jgi:anaerobic magnesium-protoporphyrin IX monomethyl ester cyclase
MVKLKALTQRPLLRSAHSVKRVYLITPCPFDLSAFGVRALSAYLKKASISVSLIFFPGGIDRYRHTRNYIYKYPEAAIDKLAEITSDASLIGFSFMSLYYDRALQLTRGLKKRLDKRIIWGGVHPMVNLRESLEDVDAVCIGEGENTILSLAQGYDFSEVPNLAYMKDGEILNNPLSPLLQDVDSLPFSDIDTEGHFLYIEDKSDILPLDEDLYKFCTPRFNHPDGRKRIGFRLMTTRGCPHACSYCINSYYHKLYKNQMHLRRRSVDNVLEEIRQARERYKWIEAIQFFDDTFFATPMDYLTEFASKYKEQVNLPIYAQASPATLNETKLSTLLDAGLVWVEMGIQTSSEETSRLYDRRVGINSVKKAVSLLNRNKNLMLAPRYHIILDNPWESEDSLLETLETVIDLPRPFDACISSLTFYHETPLYERAVAEGIIKDEELEIHRHPFGIPKGDYLNLLIYLASYYHCPGFILRLLSKRSIIRLLRKKGLNSLYNTAYFLFEYIRFIKRGIRAVFKGRFFSIFFYLKRKIGVGW